MGLEVEKDLAIADTVRGTAVVRGNRGEAAQARTGAATLAVAVNRRIGSRLKAGVANIATAVTQPANRTEHEKGHYCLVSA